MSLPVASRLGWLCCHQMFVANQSCLPFGIRCASLPLADFYYEFQQGLKNSPQFPSNTKMLVLWCAPGAAAAAAGGVCWVPVAS